MGVYELSGAGSAKTPRTVYSSMNANNQYGAMVPIASVTFTSDSSGGFAFTNIPQTYQDLQISLYGRDTSANTSITGGIYLNTIATTSWSSTFLRGDGSSASSSRTTTSTPTYGGGFVVPAASATTDIFGGVLMHILNYANASTFKTVLSRSACDLNGSGLTELRVSLWGNTSAVTRIDVASSANWKAGTTATLYGIRAVSS